MPLSKLLKNENLYLKGLVTISSEDNSESILKEQPLLTKKIDTNSSFHVLPFYTSVPPSNRLVDNRNADSSGSLNLYNIIVIELKLQEEKKLNIILAPYDKILSEFLADNNDYLFSCIDITKVCSDQLINRRKSNITVKRLSSRIIESGSKNISSITLFGEDIMSPKVIMDILGADKTKLNNETIKSFNPFDYDNKSITLTRHMKPTSCRVNIESISEEEIISNIALNFDHFGNYSTYIKNYDSLPAIIDIIRYLNNIDSIKTIDIIPSKRSKRALELIENGI